jgi:hypothetical protein
MDETEIRKKMERSLSSKKFGHFGKDGINKETKITLPKSQKFENNPLIPPNTVEKIKKLLKEPQKYEI